MREQQGTEGRAHHLRKLRRGSLAVRSPHPAVDHRQEQGYPKVPRRSLRLREDHSGEVRQLISPTTSYL